MEKERLERSGRGMRSDQRAERGKKQCRGRAFPADRSFFQYHYFIGQTKDFRQMMTDEQRGQLIMTMDLQQIFL